MKNFLLVLFAVYICSFQPTETKLCQEPMEQKKMNEVLKCPMPSKSEKKKDEEVTTELPKYFDWPPKPTQKPKCHQEVDGTTELPRFFDWPPKTTPGSPVLSPNKQVLLLGDTSNCPCSMKKLKGNICGKLNKLKEKFK